MNFSDHVDAATQIRFFWYDYLSFSIILGISTAVGVYYGCFGSRQGTVNKYLLGGKKMTSLPIALSIAVGHFSSIALTTVPTEIYKFGGYFIAVCISVVFVAFIAIYFYLIVFFKLQITSTYEYLETRFDNKTRSLASFLWIVVELFPLAVVLYSPSLALSAATGFSTNTIAIVTCVVCIFYTTIGGLKAVVWTDIYQLVLIVVSISIIVVLGVTSAGGISVVLDKANQGGRLDIFDLDLDPTRRDGIWIFLIGHPIHWASYISVSQSVVQKCLALPTFKECIRSVIYFTLVFELVLFFDIALGFLLYEKYGDCDPLLSNKIQKLEQMVPYYVMDIGGRVPGVAGLFLVALCCASLSTISSSLNAMSGVIYKDFLSKMFASRPSEKKVVLILKLTIVICGIVLICVTTQIENMGDLLPLYTNFQSIAAGPLLGMFTLGVLFPRANAQGAFYSAVVSLIYMASIIFPATFLFGKNTVKMSSKPLSVEKCNDLDGVSGNYSQIFDSSAENLDLPPFIFRLSHFYNTAMGLVVTVIFGLVISYCTNKNDPPVDEDLVSPVVWYFLRRKNKNQATVPLKEM